MIMVDYVDTQDFCGEVLMALTKITHHIYFVYFILLADV